MKIFSGSANKPLAEKIAQKLNLELSPLEIHSFPDGEKRVRVLDKVLDEDVVLVQPTSPPVNLNYMELFLILDALKRSGAKTITAVIPYLGYQRQDHIFREGEGVTFSMVAKILETLKIDKIITFDLHTIKIPEFFKIPVVHLSAIPLFAKKIEEIARGPVPLRPVGARSSLFASKTERTARQSGALPRATPRNYTPYANNCVLVSPDMGGIRRIKQLSELLGNVPVASTVKNRDLKTGKIESHTFEGDVRGKKAIVLDDMISTGETIEACVNLLKENGASEIKLFATHPVFSKNASERLSNLPVEKVYVTDSVYVPEEKQFAKLEILSIAALVAKNL